MKTLDLHGKFTDAVIYTVDSDDVAIEGYALAQIQQLCDLEACAGNAVRVMPDVHPGKGCVIGLTMTLRSDKVMPNLVGVDIGCGVSCARLGKYAPNFPKLDRVVAERVPSGFAVHARPQAFEGLEELCCARHVQLERALRSLGTLGGGNHFLEVAEDREGQAFLVVHTGSRHLGMEVCEWYLRQGRRPDVPYELTWIDGDLREQYLHDMQIVQRFASASRERIVQAVARGMKWRVESAFESVHNYIDFARDIPILRKGAISAAEGEPVIVPANMRDGSLVGIGRGNPAWNWSAPHGSGRIGSRSKAQASFTLSDFKKAMNGIYSSCISRDTLDEAPFAYRAQADIAEALRDAVEVRDVLRPVYNFKAGGRK